MRYGAGNPVFIFPLLVDTLSCLGGRIRGVHIKRGSIMAHTYEELHDMTVAQLRDVAQEVEHDAISGYSTMHKEELLTALCTALGIEAHVHHEVVGIDKAAVKSKIKALKQRMIPKWKQKEYKSPKEAHQWEAWFKEYGFETEHKH